VLRWLERGLLVAGAAALIWCGVFVADLVIAQRTARHAPPAAPAMTQPLIAPALEHVTDAAPAGPTVDTGSTIAMLSIPRIGLAAAVLHGSDAWTLRRAPGHLEHTAYPGEPGNVVIAGHRDTFFRPLRNIRVGDDIFLDGSTGRFHYEVTSLTVVNPRDVSVLAATEEATLTLNTCYPFWVLGHAPDRFIVRANRVDVPVPAPLEARTLISLVVPPPPALVPWNEAVSREMGSASVVSLPAPHDDGSLVREAVERYLSMQGGYRAPTCNVTLVGDEATADCDRRTFALEHSNNAWAIREIVLR
jgi:sortase A